MKKVLAIILCAVSLLSLFACGKQQKEEPVREVIVNYESTGLQDWTFNPLTEDKTLQRLIAIDTCQYGTAGASLKQMAVAVDLFWLSVAEDREEKLDEYLKAMTDTQRDYFSFQWQMRVKYAKKIKSASDLAAGLLSDAGLRDVTLDFFRIEDMEAFDAVVMEKLRDYGVADEWRNHLDETPFTHWELEQM